MALEPDYAADIPDIIKRSRLREIEASIAIGVDDFGRYMLCTNTNDITVTIPAFTQSQLLPGYAIGLLRVGSGEVAFAAGSGVTLVSANSNLQVNGQYKTAVAVCIGFNSWVAFGDLTAAS